VRGSDWRPDDLLTYSEFVAAVEKKVENPDAWSCPDLCSRCPFRTAATKLDCVTVEPAPYARAKLLMVGEQLGKI
jgi:hypothetical protein